MHLLPIWLGDGVSDSHVSQHCSDDSPPSLRTNFPIGKLAVLVIVARLPQSSCMGFVINCGGWAARVSSYTEPYLIRIPTYVALVVHCMLHASVPTS